MSQLIAPFPWFGGKSRVAEQVWKRFGNVSNYVEPFFGSGAVLLARPHYPHIETINDKDCFVSNFWRALKNDPKKLAKWADDPVNEADLTARHLWLVNQKEFQEYMKTDPHYYDVKIAGWWVWGLSSWIGSGWCEDLKPKNQRPHISSDMGVHRKRPHLSSHQGVQRQRPHLGNSGTGVHRTNGDHLQAYFEALSNRLRRVRVCCGDWKRVLGSSPTSNLGMTGIFLDPPYSKEAERDASLYAVDDLKVAHEVCDWAVKNGSNNQMRIALCGYDNEHAMPDNWERVRWSTTGGYGMQSNGNGRANSSREVIWFSPYCRKATLL